MEAKAEWMAEGAVGTADKEWMVVAMVVAMA